VKKEFPNVTHKLINPPQAKKISAKMRSLRQLFTTTEKTVTATGKLVVYLQKQNGKIIVSVTVNSVAPLQKDMSQ